MNAQVFTTAFLIHSELGWSEFSKIRRGKNLDNLRLEYQSQRGKVKEKKIKACALNPELL